MRPIAGTVSWIERGIFWGGIAGGVIVAISVLPPIPWRYAKADGNLGARFPSDRRYTLLTAGNNFGSAVSWMKLKTNTCRAVQEFNTVSIDSTIMGVVGNAAGTGGAILGCGNWNICKAHATQRCSGYKNMVIVGILCFILLILGGIGGLASAAMLSLEARAGKSKKKQETAKMYTTGCAGFSLLATFLATVIWCATSASVLGGFRNTAYYPYPGAHAGIYLAVLAILTLCVSAGCAVYRIWPESKREPDAQPQQEALYLTQNPGGTSHEQQTAATQPATAGLGGGGFGGGGFGDGGFEQAQQAPWESGAQQPPWGN